MLQCGCHQSCTSFYYHTYNTWIDALLVQSDNVGADIPDLLITVSESRVGIVLCRDRMSSILEVKIVAINNVFDECTVCNTLLSVLYILKLLGIFFNVFLMFKIFYCILMC